MPEIKRSYLCDSCQRIFPRPLEAYRPLELEYHVCRRCLKRMKRDLKNPDNQRKLLHMECLLVAGQSGWNELPDGY